MKSLLFLLALFISLISQAQTDFQVNPKPNKDFDIIMVPFGVGHPFEVGVLNSSGKGSITKKADISGVAETLRAEYISKISEVLDFCDEMVPAISEKQDIEAIDPGPYFLMSKGEDAAATPTGMIVMVSDTALFPWVMNPDKGIPVLGSFYDMIYVSENFDYKGHCSESYEDEAAGSETEYSIDLHLKIGWNYVAYRIERIAPATDEYPAFPSKVSVTSISSLPANLKWMAYYF